MFCLCNPPVKLTATQSKNHGGMYSIYTFTQSIKRSNKDVLKIIMDDSAISVACVASFNGQIVMLMRLGCDQRLIVRILACLHPHRTFHLDQLYAFSFKSLKLNQDP
jgi:hypothetical protein